jgi:hypothetical protein
MQAESPDATFFSAASRVVERRLNRVGKPVRGQQMSVNDAAHAVERSGLPEVTTAGIEIPWDGPDPLQCRAARADRPADTAGRFGVLRLRSEQGHARRDRDLRDRDDQRSSPGCGRANRTTMAEGLSGRDPSRGLTRHVSAATPVPLRKKVDPQGPLSGPAAATIRRTLIAAASRVDLLALRRSRSARRA